MLQYFNDTTNVTQFTMRAADWQYLAGNFMRGHEEYDDISLELKNGQQIADPPGGSSPVIITDHYLGLILQLYYQLEMNNGKEIGKNVRNRFKTELEFRAATYPVITSFLADLTTLETNTENQIQESGRKWLRGKLA